MPRSPFRIVLDTNTLLRGMVATSSAAAKVRRAADARLFIPLLSKPVLDEYRAVLSDVKVVRHFSALTPELVELTLRRLLFLGDYVRFPLAQFEFRRDPRDAKFIELAIVLEATHILSSDADFLSLRSGRSDAGRRFRQRLPHVHVMDAAAFLEAYATSLGI